YIDDGLAIGMVATIFAMVLSCVPSFVLDEMPMWLRMVIPLITVPSIWMGFRRMVQSWYENDRVKLNKLANRLHRLAGPVPSSVCVDSNLISDEPEHLSIGTYSAN
ncbi:MAG: hypothetical protein ABL962_21545, partial [Fimbriimonadaceae bacterium]